MKIIRAISPAIAVMAALGGCQGSDRAGESVHEKLGSNALALTVPVDPDSDVGAMKFIFTRVSCGGEPFTPWTASMTQSLFEFALTDQVDVDGNPLAPGAKHSFADAFISVVAGCYDVAVQPLKADSTFSEQCSGATKTGVEVNDGQTTEIMLFLQCTSDPNGAIDVVSVINNAPELTVEFDPAKFIGICVDNITQKGKFCATAIDPDQDPVDFFWEQVSGAPVVSEPAVVSTTLNQDGSVTQCLEVIPAAPGKVEFKVTLLDKVKNPGGPGFITWEDFYAMLGQPEPSRAELTFPAYFVDDPNACNTGTGGCGGGP